MSLKLPNFDKFETGSQIRRSSQSVKDSVVEGYGRRRYNADFIKFLVYGHASLLEATSQTEFLDAIHPKIGWIEIAIELNKLGVRFSNFITYFETNRRT